MPDTEHYLPFFLFDAKDNVFVCGFSFVYMLLRFLGKLKPFENNPQFIAERVFKSAFVKAAVPHAGSVRSKYH